jgi:hypothetical protein
MKDGRLKKQIPNDRRTHKKYSNGFFVGPVIPSGQKISASLGHAPEIEKV